LLRRGEMKPDLVRAGCENCVAVGTEEEVVSSCPVHGSGRPPAARDTRDDDLRAIQRPHESPPASPHFAGVYPCASLCAQSKPVGGSCSRATKGSRRTCEAGRSSSETWAAGRCTAAVIRNARAASVHPIDARPLDPSVGIPRCAGSSRGAGRRRGLATAVAARGPLLGLAKLLAAFLKRERGEASAAELTPDLHAVGDHGLSLPAAC